MTASEHDRNFTGTSEKSNIKDKEEHILLSRIHYEVFIVEIIQTACISAERGLNVFNNEYFIVNAR
jgi:hypothetical protein